MRWRALQTGRVYVKQHPGDAQLSLGVLDELRDMVGKEGETFSNRVSTVSESTKTFLTVICCSQKLACTLSISHSLCSAVHNCDSLCRRSSRSPIMLSILLVLVIIAIVNNWGERERAPSCGLNGRAVMHDRYIDRYIYTAGTRYCACAALRANVAGQIGNRFNPC